MEQFVRKMLCIFIIKIEFIEITAMDSMEAQNTKKLCSKMKGNGYQFTKEKKRRKCCSNEKFASLLCPPHAIFRPKILNIPPRVHHMSNISYDHTLEQPPICLVDQMCALLKKKPTQTLLSTNSH